MKARLSEKQIADYRRHGYLFPLPCLVAEDARTYRGELESFEARIGSRLPDADPKWRSRIHLLFHWGQRLVRHPAILDAVESVIGPDIMVLTSTFFIKDPGRPEVAGWHQDATYFGLDPDDVHVTAWLALSDATEESGCMKMMAGSHRGGQLAHGNGLASSVNVAGQYVLPPMPSYGVETVSLRAGEFSLHNSLTLHESGPNHSADRRIGIGISYIPGSVRHTGSTRLPVHFVRGGNRPDCFDYDTPPVSDFDEDARRTHESSYTRFGVLYREQMRRHAARFNLAFTAGES